MNKKLMHETALAWGISYSEMESVVKWLERYIDTEYRSLTLCKLLRQKYSKHSKDLTNKPL